VHTLFRRKYLSIVLRAALILVFYCDICFYIFNMYFIYFYFVLKFLCLVCRLGGAGVGAGNLALKAPVLQLKL
jgi:hypothetical protein